MNFKKVISLLFVSLFVTASVVFAANNNRNVYSVYSENFNGVHPDAGSSDADSIQFQLWSNQSMSGSTETIDPVEGKAYSRLTNDTPSGGRYKYGGGGFVSTNSGGSHNMSAYYGGVMKFWIRSSNSNMTNFKVGIKVNNQEVLVPLSNLGFTANGQWQELTFTLSTTTDSRITSSNLGQTNILFIFNLPEANYVAGEYIEFDNIRWIQGSSGTPESFSVVTKNISDNQVTTDSISFSKGTFGQGWSVANQYVEMDIDGEFVSNNWAVRVFSSATEEEKAGLYNETINDRLPMAWKMSWTTLPFNYTDDEGSNANTLEIGENKQGDYIDLYDAGKVAIKGDGAKWWYPWFYVQKKSDTSANSLIINKEGCHTFRNTRSGQTEPDQYFDTPESSYANTYERKPKLFLACDTKKAKAVQYTGRLIVNLSYE